MVITDLDRRTLDAVTKIGGGCDFSELRIAVEGISHKMLTQNLRMLERNGLVKRCVHPTVPPRVEYTLTDSGQALRVTIGGMCEWTQRYLGEIEASRRRFGT